MLPYSFPWRSVKCGLADMPEPLDLYRAATVFLKQHGPKRALEICEEREAAMYEAGDLLGLAAWRGIKSAIQDLQAKPPPGTKLN